MVKKGYFNDGKIGNNRVRYKDPGLAIQVLNELNTYLISNGYDFIKTKQKGSKYDGVVDYKYVWQKK